MRGMGAGWRDGLLGVLIFSASLPATRAGVQGFDPLFLTAARATIAGVLAAISLVAMGETRPSKSEMRTLVVIALGVVLGFPLLSALAVRHIDAARSLVFTALLPLSTATFAVLLGGERPRAPFWAFSAAGAALVAGFALSGAGMSGGAAPTGAGALAARSDTTTGDLMMLAAVVVCGLGYAEGARLTVRRGGTWVIAWALVVSLPLALPAAIWLAPATVAGVAPSAWAGLAYVSVFSMLVGFVFWYRGLARGGAAAVGQLQLLQPFFGLALAAALLGETVTPTMGGVALAVVACVAGARRFARAAPSRPSGVPVADGLRS